MTEIAIFKCFSGLDSLAIAWDHFRKQEPRFFPSFQEARYSLETSQFRILVARNNSGVVGIACFVFENRDKKFKIGERVLFTLPVREIDLYGGSVLGLVSQEIIDKFFKQITMEWDFDLINVGEIIIGSPMHQAISHLKAGLIATRADRKDSIHWLIRLPKSFDEYLKSLTQKARRNLLYYSRKFEREFPFEFHVVHRPEQVDKFLVDGEKINRLTYKWKLGQNLRADEPNRRRCLWLANNGQLRCYIVYVEGDPCAFMGGQLTDGIYLWETSGFDPKYEKSSPGTVLLMWALRDLIENANCEALDFGLGGDVRGYKSRFGNTSINCISLQLGKSYSPYSLFLVLLQKGLSLAKNLASSILGFGPMRQRIKKAIRQYGDR